MSLYRFSPGERPRYYPGDEFTRPNTVNGITSKFYELYHLVHAVTTSGQTVILPLIEHRALLEPGDVSTCDGSENIIPINHMDESQIRALKKAQRLKSLRDHEVPVNTFPYLRKLIVGEQGLLWVCAAEEGIRSDSDTPYAPVKSAVALADIDVASATYGHYRIPRYDQADLNEFIPPEVAERANAYAFMDADSGWRAVTGADDPEYRVAKIRLFDITTDMTYQATKQ